MSDNPFLLPPGGGEPSAKPAQPRVAPDAAPTASPSHYIEVPASVESVTHRVARPAPEPDAAAAQPVAPETAPPAPAAQEPVDSVAEETRVAPPAVPRAWALELPDGTRTSLGGPLLLGRDPAGIADRPDAGLLPVADPGKTVSKTHALLEPTPDGVRVRELHSTNGVAIDTNAGRQVLAAGGEALAPSGSTIMLGSFAIRITG